MASILMCFYLTPLEVRCGESWEDKHKENQMNKLYSQLEREQMFGCVPHGTDWAVLCRYRAMMLQGVHGTGCTSSPSSSSAPSSCSILCWVCCQGKKSQTVWALLKFCSALLKCFRSALVHCLICLWNTVFMIVLWIWCELYCLWMLCV